MAGVGAEAVEPSLKVGLIDLQRAVGETIASAPDRAGAFEQTFHAGGEYRVAGVDGVLNVADQMRQTDLMAAVGPTHLACQAIGEPEVGPPWAEEGLDHRLRSVGIDDEHGVVGVVEHPSHQFALPTRTPVSSLASAVPMEAAP